jgi:aspartate kinase
MKFGGTSVADAERMLAVAEIVRARQAEHPVVVVSALAGVTDLLIRAVELARHDERESLERLLGELDRRHRWALSGTLANVARRHDLTLLVDALFEDLRQLLRAVRILGEGTPRSSDALLAFGETLSARILTGVLEDRGIPAVWIDPRDVILTDASHGAAEPDIEGIASRGRLKILPEIASGRVPVLGGFVGVTTGGHTTTLGRGGSDTSAAVLGAALGAEEIQIWTDVDGMMSADPKLVEAARPLERVSFAEAAELAYYGAKVLHPASIAPAVARGVPVRVLNSLNPSAPGTVIRAAPTEEAPRLSSVASRAGVCAVRVTSKRMRMEAGFLPWVLSVFESAGLAPDAVVSSEVAVTLVVSEGDAVSEIERELGHAAEVERESNRAIICVVGAGLAAEPEARMAVLSALSEVTPDIVALGASRTSVTALVPADRLALAVRALHRKFFESNRAEGCS